MLSIIHHLYPRLSEAEKASFSSFQWAGPNQLLASLLCSLQIVCVELEGCHLHPVPQPLDLQTLGEVVLVILTDDLLQFLNLVFHP